MDAAVIALDHPAAFDPARVGRKAAGLARARAAGLPVGPGVALTTSWTPSDAATATAVWRIISHDGDRPLVVRSSPTGAVSGLERRPATARTAHDVDTFLDAVAATSGPGTAVLVHPLITAAWQGGYHADHSIPALHPRPVVSACSTGPDAGWFGELDHVGRVVDVLSGQHLDHPPAEVLARLVRLAGRVDERLGGTHDLDWAAEADGTLHLLRVRAVPVAGGALRRATFARRRPPCHGPRRISATQSAA